jgi:23S rRNA (guanosine2251-2'-O)-methyltransferase
MQKLSMDQLDRLSVNDFKASSKNPIVIVLDNVRSLHNVGSVFRTADGFAIERIVLCGITGTPPHREIEKTALGATDSIDWIHVSDTVEAVMALKAEGYSICAVEQVSGSVFLNDFLPDLDGKYALVFGNEVNGVTESVLQHVDYCLEIPQFGTKHSFNVSVTAGILLWDFYCKMLSNITQKP